MFYIPKPRRFNYQPRFYDPQKERWEQLKAKYALDKENPEGVSDEEMEYFEAKVRRMDDLSEKKSHKLTWKDAFRKREMPEFHYTPRFSSDGEGAAVGEKPSDAFERIDEARQRKIRIKRRFDATRVTQRKQQTGWVKVALVLMVFYLVYRFYGVILQFIYKLFF